MWENLSKQWARVQAGFPRLKRESERSWKQGEKNWHNANERQWVHRSEETAGTRVQSKSSSMVLRQEGKGRALSENQRQVVEKQNFKNGGGRSFSGFWIWRFLSRGSQKSKSLDNAQILHNRLAVAEDSAVSLRRNLFLWWYRKQSFQLNVLLWCLE